MLNLAQVSQQVKTSDLSSAVINTQTPAGQSMAYRYLKQLGWVCHNSEVHPSDRVPVFRLNSASIRRDKQAPGGWIVEVAGQEYRTGDSLDNITAEVERYQPPHPADIIAADIVAEYGHDFQGRVERAVELVKKAQAEAQAAGRRAVLSFPHYNTRYDEAGYYGLRSCECDDSQFRQPRAKFGAACKHALAMEIAHRMGIEAEAVAQRKLQDWVDQPVKRSDEPEEKPWYLHPDPLNRKGYHNRNMNDFAWRRG